MSGLNVERSFPDHATFHYALVFCRDFTVQFGISKEDAQNEHVAKADDVHLRFKFKLELFIDVFTSVNIGQFG